MNSIHNNGEHDEALQKDLGELDQAYRHLEPDEPPELLDQAILNSAHRAVEKQPHWTQFGWLHGLTTAAVFVLAFFIIMNQREPVPDFDKAIRSDEPLPLQREKVAEKSSTGYADKTISEKAVAGKRMEMKAEGASQNDMLQSMPAAPAPASAAIMEEADLISDSPPVDEISMRVQSDAMAEPGVVELKQRAAETSDPEQELLDIIKLRRNGDENWKTALESFKQRYPDYPVPDELEN